MKNKSFITSCLFSLAAVAQAQETPNIILFMPMIWDTETWGVMVQK